MTTSHPTTTDAGPTERARQVADAVHSAAMEGQTVTPATRGDMDDYVSGVIDAAELVQRVRGRYGLA